MKKILIVSDEYVFSYKNNFYLRNFGQTLFSRYLDVFENIRIVARTKYVNSYNDLGIYTLPVSNPRIEIYPITFFQGPKEYLKHYLRISSEVKYSTYSCDGAILRIPSTVAFKTLSVINKHNIPYIVEVVANPLEISQSSHNKTFKLFMRIMHYQQLLACKKASGASYVTKEALQNVYSLGDLDKIESYYSSVELDDSFYTGIRNPLNKSEFVICHVSHPIKTMNKGHSTFLQVIKQLISKGYNVKAKIAGDGDLVNYFKDKAKYMGISDKIEFTGLLNKKDLKKLLLTSDFMLFPTISEGLPRVIIEAMATGLPCLSTKVGGIPELLDDDMLFTYTDVDGFSDKIIHMLNNQELYIKNSELAYYRAKEFSSDILQKRRVIFFEKFKNLLME